MKCTYIPGKYDELYYVSQFTPMNLNMQEGIPYQRLEEFEKKISLDTQRMMMFSEKELDNRDPKNIAIRKHCIY